MQGVTNAIQIRRGNYSHDEGLLPLNQLVSKSHYETEAMPRANSMVQSDNIDINFTLPRKKNRVVRLYKLRPRLRLRTCWKTLHSAERSKHVGWIKILPWNNVDKTLLLYF